MDINVSQQINYNHPIDIEESYPIKSIEEIFIKTRRSRIEIFPTNGEEIKFNLRGTLSVSSSALPIIQLVSTESRLVSNILQYEELGCTSIENLSLSIYIPACYQKKLHLQTICSPIEINELRVEELYIEGISNNIILRQLLVKNSIIKSISGKIQIKTAIGSLTLETITADMEINLHKELKELNIKTITGNTEILQGQQPKEINLYHKTITGKLKPSPFITSSASTKTDNTKINLQSVTGDIIFI